MRFLIDQCAGTLIAAWLRTQGHDVVGARDLGADLGDHVIMGPQAVNLPPFKLHQYLICETFVAMSEFHVLFAASI